MGPQDFCAKTCHETDSHPKATGRGDMGQRLSEPHSSISATKDQAHPSGASQHMPTLLGQVAAKLSHQHC